MVEQKILETPTNSEKVQSFNTFLNLHDVKLQASKGNKKFVVSLFIL